MTPVATDVCSGQDCVLALGVFPFHHDPSQGVDSVSGQASWASSAGVRRNMQANRRRDTTPERRLRKALYALGLRYRVDAPVIERLNRRPDVVFPGAKVAVARPPESGPAPAREREASVVMHSYGVW